MSRILSEITENLPANYFFFKTFVTAPAYPASQMEKLRRTRVIVATSEKLTVWSASQKSADAEEVEKVSVECPHCGEKAFFLELERREGPEIEIVGNCPDKNS